MNETLSSLVGALSAIVLMEATITPSSKAQPASAEEAQAIAQESYIYLYPLILMDLTRKQLTNLVPSSINSPDQPTHSPMCAHFQLPRIEQWFVPISIRSIRARALI